MEATPGLSCFKIHKNGKLSHIQSLKDTPEIFTDGIIGMYSHNTNGKKYLFTGGFQDNGVSSFRVFENGTFENVNNISDNDSDRYLTGTYPVDGVTLSGNHYVIVGHRHHKYYKRIDFIKKKDFVYHGDAISVFKVTKNGELVPHFTLKDNEHTKLSGQTRIEILPVDNSKAIVAIGLRDEKSIQLCLLNEKGILLPIGFTDINFPVYYGLASQKIDNNYYLLAGSVDSAVKKVFTYKINVEMDQLEKPLLKHVVCFKFKDEVTQEAIDTSIQNFKDLKTKIPEIIDFEWGKNISTEGHDDGMTHCFVLSFINEEARDIYLNHQAHIALVETIKSTLADVFVVDYFGGK